MIEVFVIRDIVDGFYTDLVGWTDRIDTAIKYNTYQDAVNDLTGRIGYFKIEKLYISLS